MVPISAAESPRAAISGGMKGSVTPTAANCAAKSRAKRGAEEAEGDTRYDTRSRPPSHVEAHGTSPLIFSDRNGTTPMAKDDPLALPMSLRRCSPRWSGAARPAPRRRCIPSSSAAGGGAPRPLVLPPPRPEAPSIRLIVVATRRTIRPAPAAPLPAIAAAELP